jgi:alkanesulfonate monooxygenase SsuD/methylene tetrahydromethanopterin reductase-like flavin-dependent oxidoreductase (luciferase family)
VTAEQAASRARSAAARLGRVGAWSFGLDGLPVAEAMRVARAVEDLGFGSLWIAEGTASREALSHAAVLLSTTSRLVVGTGIASIWARDPTAMAAGARTLADAFPGRFILGVGVSHAGAVGRRGHEYPARPLRTMREYLDAMDSAPLSSPAPDPPVTRVLAALRPRMLELAAERADGVHSYFVPVAHTRRALGGGWPAPRRRCRCRPTGRTSSAAGRSRSGPPAPRSASPAVPAGRRPPPCQASFDRISLTNLREVAS